MGAIPYTLQVGERWVNPLPDEASRAKWEKFPNFRSELWMDATAKEGILHGAFDVWALGVASATCGICIFWNTGLPSGLFVPFILATVVAGAGYVFLVLCISEILSGLPFGGGSYGLIRITIGFYPGFIIASLEVVYLMLLLGTTIFVISSYLCVIFSISQGLSPIFCLGFILISCGIILFEKMISSFLKVLNLLALYSVILLVMYCFFPVTVTDQKAGNVLLSSSNVSILNCFPGAVWIFTGIESVAYSSSTLSCPKEAVPKGAAASIISLFLAAILVIPLTMSYSAQTAGLFATQIFPLSAGFVSLFNCSYSQASALIIPIFLEAIICYMRILTTLMNALAESRLLPNILSRKFKGIPWVAMLVGTLIAYFVCLVSCFVPNSATILISCWFLAGVTSYCSYFIGYIILKLQFSGIIYTFYSPAGIFGAAYGLLVFVFGIICWIFFQNNYDGFIALGVLFVINACSSVYYFKVARKQEKLSPDEQSSLLLAHVIKLRNRSRAIIVPKETVPITRKPKRSVKVYAILQDKQEAEELKQAAEKAFCVENVDFCNAVLSYKTAATCTEKKFKMKLLHTEFKRIIDTFIADGSPSKVKISQKHTRDILQYYNNFWRFKKLDQFQRADIFDEAAIEIEEMLFDNLQVDSS